MPVSSDHQPRRAALRGLRPLVAPAVAALALLFAFTGLFTTAYRDPEPHELPVAVVGPSTMAGNVQAQLDRSAPGAFDVERYATAATAREDLLDTEVQGALITGEGTDRALLAGAYGSAPTAAVRDGFEQVAAARGSRLEVQDLAPLPAHDSRGLSSAFTVFGVVIPSVSFGVAGAVHGLARSFGLAGITVATLGILFLGQASSGGAVTALFLPEFFGAVSGWLPTGAGLAAVRNVVYFDGAAIAPPLLVLAGWGLLGLALDLVARGHPRLAVGPPRRSRTATSVA
jgi:hypothetical protein